MNRVLAESVRVTTLDPRVLLSADFHFTANYNKAGGTVHVLQAPVQVGGVLEGFTGATKGTASLQQISGVPHLVYTADVGAIGLDSFEAIVRYDDPYGSGSFTYYNSTVEVEIYLPGPTPEDDESALYEDPESGDSFYVNYFVMKDSSLSVTAIEGVLKNDRVGDGSNPQGNLTAVGVTSSNQWIHGGVLPQFGSVSVSGDGSFTYMPFTSVFADPYFTFLEDTFSYFVRDFAGQESETATVTVALVNPKLEFDGTDIDLATNMPDVWVGQPVPVTVTGTTNGTKYQWSVEGDTFKEYRIDNQQGSSEVIRLAAADLKKNSVDFKWVAEKGRRSVTATVNAPFRQQVALTKNFEVHRPEVTINAKTTGVGFVPANDGTQDQWLTMGIKFRAEGETSVGSFAWLQMIDMSSNGIEGYTEGSGLDTGFPAYTGLTASDAPGVKVPWPNPGSLTSVSYDGCFTMNLMWMSPVTGSEYVPLRSLNWFVGMSAYYDQTGWHKNSNSSGSTFNWDQNGDDLTDHPTWSNVVVAP